MAERQPVAACRFIRREFELIRRMRGAKEDFAAKFPTGYGLVCRRLDRNLRRITRIRS
jgi:hypothetical protein